MLYFLLFTAIVLVATDVLCIKFLKKKGTVINLGQLPRISILVAARNEEENILACLKALNNLHYPQHRLQILIGNDSSTDKTVEIVENFIQGKSKFQLIHISENIGNAVGKANVLAQLAHEAKGEWLFFTDADIIHQPNWVLNMLELGGDKDLITGFTWIENNALQAIEWTLTLGVAKIFSDFKLPTTAMGNNMAVKKEAYLKTGGYEALKSSVVEDFVLLQAIIKQGGSFINLLEKDIKAISKPTKSFLELLQQRKRWMQGAIQAPWYAKTYITLKVMFIFALLGAFLINPEQWQIILGAWGIKIISQSLLVLLFLRRIQQKVLWMYLLFYEVYTSILTPLFILYYVIPFRVFWKGRKY